ncbi:DUF1488 domain-containing protein [Rheinheimera sp.]|uniref:DUF1488 domain-containing protein n=1 Tax=Rheinheimera sp. TaxID=1869214 RepID=UPI00307EE0E7
MNQQLIFNHDFAWHQAEQAVQCSCLQSGLKIVVYIKKPEGWLEDAWVLQVKEDYFFWEEEIEAALETQPLGHDAVLRLEGAA